jgi:hypothetical protein
LAGAWLLVLPLVGLACSQSPPAEGEKKAELTVAKTQPPQPAPAPEHKHEAPKPVLRSVRISSDPGGAEIIIDHVTLPGKTTPAEVDLAAGEHVVQVQKSNYLPSEPRTITITGGQSPSPLAFALRAPPPPAPAEISIALRCNPATATLVVDGASVPLEQGRATLKRPTDVKSLAVAASAPAHARLERRFSSKELEAAGHAIDVRLNPYLHAEPQDADLWVDSQLVAADAEGRRELPRKASDSYQLILSRPGFKPLSGTFSYEELLTRGFTLSLQAETKPVAADTWLRRAGRLKRQSAWPAHAKTVYAVAFGPKNRFFASAGRDERVKLSSYPEKELSGGALPATPVGELKHDKPVLSLAFSPDGQWLATGSADKQARLWDVQSRQLSGKFAEGDWVWSVAFSHDGGKLATAAGDGTVSLWNVSSRSRVGSAKKLHEETVNCIAFSPDDRTLASAGADGGVALWTVGTEEVTTLRTGSQAVLSLAFSPDGGTLASGGDDSSITLWDVAKRQRRSTLGRHAESVHCVAYSPDGKILASAGGDKVVKLWDPTTGKLLQTLPHDEQVFSVAFAPAGWLLASGGSNGGVTLWRSGD